jgi:hypothetical protein
MTPALNEEKDSSAILRRRARECPGGRLAVTVFQQSSRTCALPPDPRQAAEIYRAGGQPRSNRLFFIFA